MSLRHAILGVLTARPMTGYELSQFLASSTGWLWSATHSQIYPALAKLREQGLIEGIEGVRGESLRKVEYRITEAGERELVTWLSSWHDLPDERDPFLLQAVFLDQVPPAAAIACLRKYVEVQEADAVRAEQHAALLAQGETPLIRERFTRSPAETHEYAMLVKSAVFRGQASVARARAAWAGELADLIEARIGAEPIPAERG
ncbi:PadR family transcriptional regulator [Granulicoccus phenolivorans]|uniref:PadR family transcriptional regulator n=1 Tax=Granulicoccus phenolivorans TaxID=266854 RepID=UPI00041F6039|nr:PadR family transcriptional regulator [Granulicoccus phenolivorans]